MAGYGQDPIKIEPVGADRLDQPPSGPALALSPQVKRERVRSGKEAGVVAEPTADSALEGETRGLRAIGQPTEGHPVGIAEQLADDESAARLKDASQLAQRSVLVGHLAERDDRVRGVEGRVRVGQRLRVATARGDASDRRS